MEVKTAVGARPLPATLRTKLLEFRKGMWTTKMAEVSFGAIFGLVFSFLLVFGLDRWIDTPALVRFTILVMGCFGGAVLVPLQAYRWVLRRQRFEDVARVISRKDARAGDQLLGIVELTQSESEFARSPQLCEAAIDQVDRSLRERDFAPALPDSRHRGWLKAALAPLAVVVALGFMVPDATSNAVARWLGPFGSTARYTFTQTDPLPHDMVVAKGEPFPFVVKLSEDTRYSPDSGTLQFEDQRLIEAELVDGAYHFLVPSQTEIGELDLRVGDLRQTVQVEPKARPAIASISATVSLPAYLELPEPRVIDVRSGSLPVVKGSKVQLRLRATRELASATFAGEAATVDGAEFTAPEFTIDESRSVELNWEDKFRLVPKEAATFAIHARDDEAPSLTCSGLKREMVVLETDTLSFETRAQDDFGVREIGMVWEGIPHPVDNPKPAIGEKLVAAGAPEQAELEAVATFCAQQLHVKAQPLRFRLYTIDSLPGRERVYTMPYTLYVLTPEEHMIWVTQQLGQWFQHAVEVRDREKELFQKNQELRGLSSKELDRPENRRKIENQAVAERSNGRRLDRLTDIGKQLVSQAARNSEFNVQTMDKWAEMVKALENIAENRMPSVAELLAKAAKAPGASPPKSESPNTGLVRDSGEGSPQPQESEESKEVAKVPAIADVESSFNDPPEDKPKEPQEGGAPPPKLGLVNTVVTGGGAKGDDEAPPQEESPAQEELGEAVEEQEKLLEEFAKIAGDIKEILRNLEGSTFVKRLKAASRRQTQVSKDMNKSLEETFGRAPEEVSHETTKTFDRVAKTLAADSEKVSVIQTDLEGYVSRIGEPKFTTVLDEMKDMAASAELREIADQVEESRSGDSLARAEFWSDTFDRWAEQLVGPG